MTCWSCDTIGTSIDIMSIVLSIALFHSLGQDDHIDMPHDLFGHVMPLALTSTSCDTDSIVSGPFYSLNQDIKMKCTMMFWLFDAIGTGISVT